LEQVDSYRATLVSKHPANSVQHANQSLHLCSLAWYSLSRWFL